MKPRLLSLLSTIVVVSVSMPAPFAAAHCQVPCGVYGDQRRFEEMLEDTETVAKAIAQINELAGTHDATGHNQLARWVANKEKHAANIQFIIGDYFLAQRVKMDNPKYVEQLKACHAVIVAAMKAKQAADPATAAALKAAIGQLYTAYTGKAPQFGRTGKPVTYASQYVLKRDRGEMTAHADHGHAEHHEHGHHDHGHHADGHHDHGDHDHSK